MFAQLTTSFLCVCSYLLNFTTRPTSPWTSPHHVKFIAGGMVESEAASGNFVRKVQPIP